MPKPSPRGPLVVAITAAVLVAGAVGTAAVYFLRTAKPGGAITLTIPTAGLPTVSTGAGGATFQGKALGEWLKLSKDSDYDTALAADRALRTFAGDRAEVFAATKESLHLSGLITAHQAAATPAERAHIEKGMIWMIDTGGAVFDDDARDLRLLSPRPVSILPALQRVLISQQRPPYRLSGAEVEATIRALGGTPTTQPG